MDDRAGAQGQQAPLHGQRRQSRSKQEQPTVPQGRTTVECVPNSAGALDEETYTARRPEQQSVVGVLPSDPFGFRMRQRFRHRTAGNGHVGPMAAQPRYEGFVKVQIRGDGEGDRRTDMGVHDGMPRSVGDFMNRAVSREAAAPRPPDNPQAASAPRAASPRLRTRPPARSASGTSLRRRTVEQYHALRTLLHLRRDLRHPLTGGRRSHRAAVRRAPGAYRRRKGRTAFAATRRRASGRPNRTSLRHGPPALRRDGRRGRAPFPD